MVGIIKSMLDSIIEQRSKGNQTLVNTTKSKLLLKGIDYDKFTSQSPDDAVTIAKVKQCAQEMGIEV
jgi:DNA polymerase III sliding clamp (beta) subunit (PCNA family)